jgi:hypothetical protein
MSGPTASKAIRSATPAAADRGNVLERPVEADLARELTRSTLSASPGRADFDCGQDVGSVLEVKSF